MKRNNSRGESEACAIMILWVIGFGIACYLHSIMVFILATAYLVTLFACSWRIERLEKRIDYYRHELDKQMRAELNAEDEDKHKTITMTKVG